MRSTLALLIASSLIAALAACSSTSNGDSDADRAVSMDWPGPACLCGEDAAARRGCPARACLTGQGNPENLACACGVQLGGGLGGEMSIEGKGGLSHTGAVKSWNGETLVLEIEDGEELRVPRGRLSPRTVQALERAETAADDFEGLMLLATQAREEGLYDRARRFYTRAVRVAPERIERIGGELATLRRELTEVELRAARTALGEGRLGDARASLTFLVEELTAEPGAQVARFLLDDLFERERAREALAFEELGRRAQRLLEPARKHLERARDAERKGLANTTLPTQAMRSYQDAVSAAKSAYVLLDKLESRLERDRREVAPRLQNALAAMRAEVVAVGVEAYAHAARAYLAREAWTNARDAAQAALEIDGEDARTYELLWRAQRARGEPLGSAWPWYASAPGRGPRSTTLPVLH